MKSHRALIFGLLWCLCGPARIVHAELSPGAYEQLLADAQEVYRLKITSVAEQPADSSGVQHFQCEAEILGVERSKAGRKPGDTIRFATYYVPPEVLRRGFAGPKNPPLVKAGWEGLVYLNPSAAGKGSVLQLAAYGRSFVSGAARAAGGRQAPPAETSGGLGIIVRPSLQGGLEVVSIRRDSLADDLGLRSGDRIMKVNGRPVAAPADVRAAIETDPSRVAVSLERKQKSIEISIVR
jgi:hypothetical protein